MSRALAIACLALSGCASWWADEPEVVAPKQTPVDAYADAGDALMDKAAASVAVARKANADGKPTVVEAELGVASNLLPRPSTQQLKAATDRAAKSDPAAYLKAMEEADRLQRELDTLWGKVEAEKATARAALEAKQMELDAERAKTRDLLWSGIGLALVALAAAGFVWGSAFGVTKAEAVLVLGLGFACGSLPWVLDSDLSGWIIAPAGALIALRLIVFVWKKPTQSINLDAASTHKAKEPPGC